MTTIADLEEAGRLLWLDSREEWLLHRGSGYGATDARVISGLDKWKTPLRLYGEKRGEIEKEDRQGIALRMGLALEPFAREIFREEEPDVELAREVVGRTEYPVVLGENPQHRFSPDDIVVEPVVDGSLVDAFRGQPILGPLEIKTASAFLADEWKVGVPLPYLVQIQWEIHVLGSERAWCVAIIGNHETKVVEVPRHDDFIARLVDRVDEFHQRVVGGDPPPAEADDAKTIEALVGDSVEGRVVTLDAGFGDTFDQIEDLKATRKTLDARIATLQNRVKQAIGDAEYGLLPGDRGAFKYATEHRAERTQHVKAWSGRVLRKVKNVR